MDPQPSSYIVARGNIGSHGISRVSIQVELPRLRMQASPAQCGASFVASNDELSGNGTSSSFTLTLTYTDRVSGGTPQQAPFPLSGTYSVSGNNVTFSTAFGAIAASHVGDELRITLDLDADFDDDQVVFKKQ